MIDSKHPIDFRIMETELKAYQLQMIERVWTLLNDRLGTMGFSATTVAELLILCSSLGLCEL